MKELTLLFAAAFLLVVLVKYLTREEKEGYNFEPIKETPLSLEGKRFELLKLQEEKRNFENENLHDFCKRKGITIQRNEFQKTKQINLSIDFYKFYKDEKLILEKSFYKNMSHKRIWVSQNNWKVELSKFVGI